jgi:hypothetical protein
MESGKYDENQRLARVVEQRVGVGQTEMVSGWQAVLNDLLSRMKPYINVYDRGQLMAGYQYATIDECRADLASVLGRYLGMPSTRT